MLVRCLGRFLFSILVARVCCVFRHPRNAGVFFYLIGFVFALSCSLSFIVFWSILYSHASARELSLLCWLFISFHASYKYTLSLYPALSRRPSASSRCQSGKMMTRRGRPSNSTRQHRNTSELEISGNFETYLAVIGQLFSILDALNFCVFAMPFSSRVVSAFKTFKGKITMNENDLKMHHGMERNRSWNRSCQMLNPHKAFLCFSLASSYLTSICAWHGGKMWKA